MASALLRTLLTPWWAAQLLTSAKSFIDNPLIGSDRLNRAGLHRWRVQQAARMAQRRRARLADAISDEDRTAFDRDGFVCWENFLPSDVFSRLHDQALSYAGPAREMVQGDAITRRYAVDPPAMRSIPDVRALIRNPRWRAMSRYAASFDIEPLLYIQSILSHRHDAVTDPQTDLHADTFHPTMKAWLFLQDVDIADGPLTYVRGSHRLTEERLAWEHRQSLDVRDHGDILSARGSFRIGREELAAMNLPEPTPFVVPANTLIIADTFGFHARGASLHRSTRIEFWAYSRRNPFLPFTGLDPWSLPGIAEWRVPLHWLTHDIYRRLIGQPWAKAGHKRPDAD